MVGASDRNARRGADLWLNFVALDTVLVSSPQISKPVAVRYAWADNPLGANLYNAAGLPASPFRTDDWPEISRNDK
jgi:sialate O-acetylesterase